MSVDRPITVLLPTQLRSGDVVVSSANTLEARLIQWVTRGDRSHAAMVINPSSTMFEAMDDASAVWGALSGRPTGSLRVVRTLNQCYVSRKHVIVLRPRGAVSEDLENGLRVSLEANALGSAYYGTLLAAAGVMYEYCDVHPKFATLANCLVDRHRALGRPSAYCSQIIARAYEKILNLKFAVKPTEFVLPKDLRVNEVFEAVSGCTREIYLSWRPLVPEAPLAPYHRILRAIVRDENARRALVTFWRSQQDGPQTELAAQTRACEPASALIPLLSGPDQPGAQELDQIAYAIMASHDYKRQLLDSIRKATAPPLCDEAWREEVRRSEEDRFSCEQAAAVSTFRDIKKHLALWPESRTLHYWHDAYKTVVRRYAEAQL